MIFVCHFSNSSEIIDSILLNAYSIFENYKKFDFLEKNPLIDDINVVIKAVLPNNIGDNDDVRYNKEQKFLAMDDAGINDGRVKEEILNDDEDEISEKEKDLQMLSAALKTLDVLGQILQNYPGDINGERKSEIIDEIHGLGMRSVQAIMTTMELTEDELIKMILKRTTNQNKTWKTDKIILETKRIFTYLLSGMVRAMIRKIAFSINSKHLLQVSKETLEKNGSVSGKLVVQELKYNFLNEPNVNELFTFYEQLKKDKNKFAICILKSSIANYLKYNECSYQLRNKLCSKFELDVKKTIIANTRNTLQSKK